MKSLFNQSNAIYIVEKLIQGKYLQFVQQQQKCQDNQL